jgi:hypothetical protein
MLFFDCVQVHNLYSSPNIIRIIKSRRIKWTNVVRMVKRNECRILVGNPQGKRPLGKPRRTWVDNIKIDVREIGWDGMEPLLSLQLWPAPP